MLEVKSTIIKSRLYISPQITEAFDNWYEVAKPIFEAANTAVIDIYRHSWRTDEDEMNAALAEDSELNRLPRKSMKEFEAVFDAVQSDVSNIQLSLEYSLTSEELEVKNK